VLTKFTALVDPIKAGLKSSAYVTLKVQQHSWRELREQLRAIPEVHHIALVGGDFDVILLVRAVDNVHLRRVIFDQLQSMPGVLDTQTFLVFEDVDTVAGHSQLQTSMTIAPACPKNPMLVGPSTLSLTARIWPFWWRAIWLPQAIDTGGLRFAS
jgi:hypothetical protein